MTSIIRKGAPQTHHKHKMTDLFLTGSHIGPWRRKRPRPVSMTDMILLCLSLLVFCASASQAFRLFEENIELCSGVKSLRSKFFVPFYEQIRPVEAHCFSKELTASSSVGRLAIKAGYEVHVVRINTAAKNVMLTIKGV